MNRFEISQVSHFVAAAALVVLCACDEVGKQVNALLERGEPEKAANAATPEAPPAEELPEKPATSTARSETEVISFRSVLEDTEMTREERIRAFQNLDPGALQKPVVQPSVLGGPTGAQVKRSPSGQSPSQWEVDAARRKVPIVMYSTAWCGVCKRARAYFLEKNIAFEDHDVDKEPTARAEYERLNPRRSVPTIKVGDELLIGFSPAAFESARDAAARSRIN